MATIECMKLVHGGEIFTLPVEAIREIVAQPTACTAFFCKQYWIDQIIFHNETIIPVFNMAALSGKNEEEGLKSVFVVAQFGGNKLAVKASNIQDTIVITDEELAGADERWGFPVIQKEKELIIVPDFLKMVGENV